MLYYTKKTSNESIVIFTGKPHVIIEDLAEKIEETNVV